MTPAARRASPRAMPTQRRPTEPAQPPPPAREVAPVVDDPQLRFEYWNHPCPGPGCGAWVARHLAACGVHARGRR